MEKSALGVFSRANNSAMRYTNGRNKVFLEALRQTTCCLPVRQVNTSHVSQQKKWKKRAKKNRAKKTREKKSPNNIKCPKRLRAWNDQKFVSSDENQTVIPPPRFNGCTGESAHLINPSPHWCVGPLNAAMRDAERRYSRVKPWPGGRGGGAWRRRYGAVRYVCRGKG